MNHESNFNYGSFAKNKPNYRGAPKNDQSASFVAACANCNRLKKHNEKHYCIECQDIIYDQQHAHRSMLWWLQKEVSTLQRAYVEYWKGTKALLQEEWKDDKHF